MVVVDTSVILAFMNSTDAHHPAVSNWMATEAQDLATTPLIIAEADHLVAARGGRQALRALRKDLAAGAYMVDWWPEAMGAAVRVAERYSDMSLGLADASLVVLAERLGTVRIATLDERHFRAVRPLTGASAFHLLPQDG